MIDQKTIIDKVEEEKFASFQEPVRKGLKRGSKRGFPLNKEKAVWLAVKGVGQKEVSETLNVNFSQVRHWFVEPDFREKVEEYSQEVVSQFLVRLAEMPPANGGMKSPMAEFGKRHDYGRPLTERIVRQAMENVNGKMSFLLLENTYNVLKDRFTMPHAWLESFISLHHIVRFYHRVNQMAKLRDDHSLKEILKTERIDIVRDAESHDKAEIAEKLLRNQEKVLAGKMVVPVPSWLIENMVAVIY